MRATALLFLSVLIPVIAYAEEQEKFKIGVLAAFTGRLAEYGVAVRNGIELAREEYPDKFKNIEFVYEDDQYDPKVAATGFQKLTSADQVRLVYQWGNEPALTVAPIAEAKQFPLVTIAQDPHAATPSQKWVTRFINTAKDWQRGMAEYLREENVETVLVLKTEMSFTSMLVEALKSQLSSSPQVQNLDSVLPTETDFRPLVLRAKSQLRGGILGLYLTPSQSVLFIKQAETLDFHPRMIGATFFESRSLLKPVWSQLQGAVYIHLAVDPGFRNRYEKRFALIDQIPYAWNAYQFALFAARRYGTSQPTISADEILQALRTGGFPEEPMRLVEADGERYFRFPLALEKIEGQGTVSLRVIK